MPIGTYSKCVYPVCEPTDGDHWNLLPMALNGNNQGGRIYNICRGND